MPLQAHIDTAAFDALPDVTVLGKDSFVKNEKENKFFLNLPADEAGKLAFNLQESVRKLTENNADLLRQKGDANTKAKAYESLGKTADELKEILDSKRPEDLQKLIESHRLEIDNLKRSFQEGKDKDAASIEALTRQLSETNTKATISRLRAEYDLNDTADFVLREFIKSEPKEEGSFEFVTRVYENGNPALLAGESMSPDQLIKSFQEAKKFPAMFNVGNGNGPGNTNRTTNTGLNKQLEGLSAVERLKVARQNGATT